MAGLEQDEDIFRALAWIRHCAGDGPREGLRRTTQALEHYHAHCALKDGRWVRQEPLLLAADLPGSWVAQAVAFLTKANSYDARLGSRILPLIKAIGVALPDLARVPGAKERVRRMMADRSRSPESAFSELATAGRYLREGMEVSFLRLPDQTFSKREARREPVPVALMLEGRQRYVVKDLLEFAAQHPDRRGMFDTRHSTFEAFLTGGSSDDT